MKHLYTLVIVLGFTVVSPVVHAQGVIVSGFDTTGSGRGISPGPGGNNNNFNSGYNGYNTRTNVEIGGHLTGATIVGMALNTIAEGRAIDAAEKSDERHVDLAVTLAKIHADSEEALAAMGVAAATGKNPAAPVPAGGAAPPTTIPRMIYNDEKGMSLIVTVGSDVTVIPPKSPGKADIPITGAFTMQYVDQSTSPATLSPSKCSEEKKGLVCNK